MQFNCHVYRNEYNRQNVQKYLIKVLISHFYSATNG